MRWETIDEFPLYEISEEGDVRNRNSKRVLRYQMSNQGIRVVGLFKDGDQPKRSVARLVATHHLLPHEYEHFDTPIHKNGIKEDCRKSNLAWRPRWFAVKYHQQFDRTPLRPGHPVIEVETGIVFDDIRDAAVARGVLEEDVAQSVLRGGVIFYKETSFEFV